MNWPRGVEPPDVLRALLGSVRATEDALAAHLWIEDSYSSTLRLVATDGDPACGLLPLSTKGTLLGEVLNSGTTRLAEVEDALCLGERQKVWQFLIPLDTTEVRGVAAVDVVSAIRPDPAVLTLIAARLRGALTATLTLHAARADLTISRIILEASSSLLQAKSADAVIRESLHAAMRLSGAQTGSVMLVDAGNTRMRILFSEGLPEDVVASTAVAEGEGISGWVLASGRGLVIEDWNSDGLRNSRRGVRSAMSVPIQDDQGSLGVINVGSASFGTTFLPHHVSALEMLGRATASALRSAWSTESAREMYLQTLEALVLALESKDPYSQRGTERIVKLSMRLGKAMAFPGTDLEALRIAAMLRDVGMLAVGESVAASSKPLSTVEWGMLKMHPAIAGDILARMPALRLVEPIVSHHHERYDGAGYTAGLSGADIPLGARALAAVDAYVAMTSNRPYRPALDSEGAICELKVQAGRQFDPEIVESLVALLKDGE